MNKIELLAPAGDLEKLKAAIDYGADAVYFGGEAFSLRAGAGNFTEEEMLEGIKKNSPDVWKEYERLSKKVEEKEKELEKEYVLIAEENI